MSATTEAVAALVPRETRRSPGAHRVQPVQESVDDLAAPGAGGPEVRLWWLGQAGFALRHPGGRVLVDPYLSDSLAAKYAGRRYPHVRLHEPPVDAADLRDIDLVLHTHAHTDHLDPWTVRGLLVGSRPRFVAPRARRDVALERHVPVDLLDAVDAGERLDVHGTAVTAVPAAHEELTRDAEGNHHFLGYVIEAGGVRLYHSGDCVPFAGQAELLAALDVDVALLPVNGRDAERLANGVPGNFTVDEAVQLCRDAGIPELVCHHIGLFDFNTVAPAAVAGRLEEIAGDIAWTVPAVGAGFRIAPPTPPRPEEPR